MISKLLKTAILSILFFPLAVFAYPPDISDLPIGDSIVVNPTGTILGVSCAELEAYFDIGSDLLWYYIEGDGVGFSASGAYTNMTTVSAHCASNEYYPIELYYSDITSVDMYFLWGVGSDAGSGSATPPNSHRYQFYQFFDNGDPLPLPVDDDTTRIIANLPDDGSYVATSTNFGIGGTVYINENDLEDGMYFHVEIAKNDQTQAVGPLFAVEQLFGQESWRFEIDIAGQTTFSSTTQRDAIGVYRVSTSIRSDGFWFLPDDVLTRNTTYFTVGTTTGLDKIMAADIELMGTMADNLDCELDWTSVFDLGLDSPLFGCIAQIVYRLIVPSSEQMSMLALSLRDSVLEKAPFGYATRLYDILQTPVTAASLPSTATVVPSYLPGGGTAINFDVFTQIPIAVQTIEAQTVPTMTGNPMTNFIYWWEIIWKIIFGMWLVKTFYGAFQSGDLDGFAPGPRGRFNNDVQKRRRSFAVERQARREGPDNSDMRSKY